MSGLVAWLDRHAYADIAPNWDDKLFRDRILVHLSTQSLVLDLGAGAGIVTAMNFRGRAAKICGVDLDPRVLDNPLLDEARVADAANLPFPEASFDLVIADNVVEHLARPLDVFCEVFRVLKPGGVFLFKTPNKAHYVPTVARLTPQWFHEGVAKLRGRAAADTFPTFYRANAASKIKRLAQSAGFADVSIDRIESRPEYMRLFSLSYILGLCYERLVNMTDALAMFRILLIAELHKPLISKTAALQLF